MAELFGQPDEVNPMEQNLNSGLPMPQPAMPPAKIWRVGSQPSRNGDIWAQMVAIGEVNGQVMPVIVTKSVALECCGTPARNPYDWLVCQCGCQMRCGQCCVARCSLCGIPHITWHLAVDRETGERFCATCV